MIVHRNGNYRVYKFNEVFVIMDNRGKDCGRFDSLNLAIIEVEQLAMVR